MRISPVARVLVAVVLGLWPIVARADCGFYRYPPTASVGRHCASTEQAPPPQRVTAVCWDRTYSFDQGHATCQANGGVRIWLR
jgi:hypothetical protein